MSDIYLGCSIDEPQKNNLTIRKYIDDKLKKGELDTLLLENINALTASNQTLAEENERMKSILKELKSVCWRSKADGEHRESLMLSKIESALEVNDGS
jgi:phosphomevalonate kinase